MLSRFRVLLGASLLLLYTACNSVDLPLPQSIATMRLDRVQSGKEARQEIDRLHGKQISFRRGYIGTYVADNGDAKLWLSVHSTEGEAAEAMEKMAQSMRQGKQQSFWHFRKIMIGQRQVYFALGMGKAHYFFQKGPKVVWLAVDPPMAKEAIRDTLDKI